MNLQAGVHQNTVCFYSLQKMANHKQPKHTCSIQN